MKKITIVLMSLILFIIGTIPVLADGKNAVEGKLNIVDHAGILSDEQELELAKKNQEIKDKYGFNAVILTVPGLEGKTPKTFLNDFYKKNYDQKDGIVFLVSMGERDYFIDPVPDNKAVFTIYGIDYIVENIIPHLSDGNYFKSFSMFLGYTGDFLEEASTGTAYDTENKIIPRNMYMMYAVLIALVIAIIVLVVLIVMMQAPKPQDLAHAYSDNQKSTITVRKDVFLYKTVSKSKKSKDDDDDDDDSGGGGGSSGRGGSF